MEDSLDNDTDNCSTSVCGHMSQAARHGCVGCILSITAEMLEGGVVFFL